MENLEFTLKVKNRFKLTQQDLLLAEEPIFLISPKLIELLIYVGYNRSGRSLIEEALILQQMHIELERNGIVYKNYKWIEGDIYDWLNRRFSLFKRLSFDNALNRLIKDGFIKQMKTPENKSLFRINYKRFFHSKKIEKAKKIREKEFQKLKEYKSKRRYAILPKSLRKKAKMLEEKLKKKPTKAVFFKIS